jgi:hypothetical protein
MAFLCYGVVTRINYEGIRRSDEVCRACVVAWWLYKPVAIPTVGAALIGTGIIITDDPPPEPSPARP